jgi:hypothetical protein
VNNMQVPPPATQQISPLAYNNGHSTPYSSFIQPTALNTVPVQSGSCGLNEWTTNRATVAPNVANMRDKRQKTTEEEEVEKIVKLLEDPSSDCFPVNDSVWAQNATDDTTELYKTENVPDALDVFIRKYFDPCYLAADLSDGNTSQAKKYVHGLEDFRNALPAQPFQPDCCQPAPLSWLGISYYEYTKKCGESFNASDGRSEVFVDGGLDPSGHVRYCLGSITNLERDAVCERIRRQIGKGIRLDLRGDGDIWLTVLSKQPVFVQSYYLDMLTGRTQRDLPHKFLSCTTVKIFDLKLCHDELREKSQYNHLAKQLESATLEEREVLTRGMDMRKIEELADIGVDDLRRLCSLKLSFVKGYGFEYPRRTIAEVPCWIEMQVHRALQLLDEALNTPTVILGNALVDQ